MDSMHFQYSPNILMPFWPTIRMENKAKYLVGATKLITNGKQKKEIGEAKITHIGQVLYKGITNELAFTIAGKPAPYVKGVLAKMYPHIHPDTVLNTLVMEWTQRYLQQQEDLVKQWWESQVAQTPNYSEYKMRIAS